jgi:hypothetical protein
VILKSRTLRTILAGCMMPDLSAAAEKLPDSQ